MEKLNFLINSILDLIYFKEGFCLSCGNELFTEKSLCNDCIKRLNLCVEKFNIGEHKEIKCYTCSIYSKTIKKLILKLKYKNGFSQGELLSSYIYRLVLREKLNFDMITFVPSSRKRKRERGYNQSEILAKNLSKHMNIKCYKLLIKNKDTKDQIGLNEDQRWENVNDVFCINSKYNLKQKKILIIDDVITTGATVYNCSKELLRNGASEVIVIGVARNI